MKTLLLAATAAALAALAWAAQDTPKATADTTPALAGIYDHVLQHNARQAVSACQQWAQQLDQTAPGQRSDSTDTGFAQLVRHWKTVEATYIAGELDAEAIDYPRYIDVFHTGNEDIRQQMAKAVRSQATPETALFKHAHKTVNALEALLYQDKQLSERELALARVASAQICGRLQQIDASYARHRNDFLAQPDKALSMLVNVLANQSFSLKEWRIGDVAGLSKRYVGKPDVRRSEYPLSGQSLPAIRAILAAQAQLVQPQAYPNLVQIAQAHGAEATLANSARLLDEAQQAAAALDQAGFAFEPAATEALYRISARLQSSYYQNLVHALPVVAKILEADGD